MDCYPFTPPTPEARAFAYFFDHRTSNILPYLKLSSSVAPFLYVIISTFNFNSASKTTTRKSRQLSGKARQITSCNGISSHASSGIWDVYVWTYTRFLAETRPWVIHYCEITPTNPFLKATSKSTRQHIIDCLMGLGYH